MNGRSFPGHFKTCPMTDLGIILCPSGISYTYILSMDVGNETTLKTYLPNHYVSFDRDILSLIELGGHLSFRYTYTAIQFNVWILKDVSGQNWPRSYSIFADSINYLLPHGTSPHRRVEKCFTELCETYSRLQLEKWWSYSVQAVEISLVVPLRYQDQGVEEIEWAFVEQGLYLIAIQEQPCLLARWCRTIGSRNYLAPSNVLLNKPRLGSTLCFAIWLTRIGLGEGD